MKKIVHKSAAPIYAAAVVWVLYALLLPLYKPGHFIMAAAASVVVFLIARIFCKDVVEEVEEKPQPTGNPELDKMISDGELAIREMKRLNDSIKDETISRQIDRLEEVSNKIFDCVKADPKKLPQIRKFMNYYLPTTLKLLENYADFEEAGVSGENLSQAKSRIAATMDNIVAGFEHQLDELYRTDAMDVDSDIRVMETMLRRDTASAADDFGLGGAAVQRQPEEE